MKQLLIVAALAALPACSNNKPADSPANQPTATATASADEGTTTVIATPENPESARSSTVGTDSSWGSPGYGSGSGQASGTQLSSRDSYSAGTTSPRADVTSAPAPAPATAPSPAPAQDATGAAAARPDADNTRVNKRDQGSSALTPMDQGGAASDRKITQQIRQAVVGDHSLSFLAKNVKIITQGGKVTLRGAVKTDQERASIEAAARKYAADGQVDNQIEVKKLKRKRE